MRSLLSNKTFSSYLLAYIVTSFGTWVRFVVTPLYIYQLTGSYISMGISFIITSLPKLTVAPLIAHLFDSIQKKYILFIVSFLQGVFVFLYIVFPNIYIVYTISFVLSLISVFGEGASLVIVKNIVPAKSLMKANSLLITVSNILLFVGPIAGGFIADRFGYQWAYAIDGSSYILFAIILLFIKVPNTKLISDKPEKLNLKYKIKDFISIIKNKRVLKVYIVTSIFLWVGVNGILIVYPVLCNSLTSQTTAYGTLWAVIGAGQMLGGIAIGWIKLHGKSRMRVYYYSLLLTGTFHLLFSVSPNFLLALIMVFIATLGDGSSIVIEDYFIQRKVKEDYILRYTSYMNVVIALAGVIGSTIVTFLLKRIPYQIAGVLSSSMIITSAVIGLVLISKLASSSYNGERRNYELS